MTDPDTPSNGEAAEGPPPTVEESAEAAALRRRLADLDELSQAVQRRIRSNQRFLERFLDEDFVDDEELPEVEDDPEDLEEL